MMIGFIYDDEAARLLVILFILVMIVFIGDWEQRYSDDYVYYND